MFKDLITTVSEKATAAKDVVCIRDEE